ncbi:hypothetical protein GRB29_08375 [Streptococcus pneumoniae]|nr:hypothetical protein [Streptococcus pneumoniae]
MKKLLKKIIWPLLCILLFLGAFGYSAHTKFIDLMGVGSGFSLQGAATDEKLNESEYSSEVIDIKYIKSDGTIDIRPIILYKPTGVDGDIPLIYIPHYAADTKTADFVSYIKNGWAVASPHNFDTTYNGVLETDSLVFNNAAFYSLRHLEGIEKQRIAIVGGSAGGYTSLMLNGLQMGITAGIANSPITNAYFNFKEYFPAADKVNHQSPLFDFTMPTQGMVSKYFQPINDVIGDDYERWEAVSPISLAKTMSNPVVINHNTADILVPIDQVTKRFTYDENDGSLPKDFTARLDESYPGILGSSFEEMADPSQLHIEKYQFENNMVTGSMPYSDKLITINIIDDGKISAKGSHNAPGLTGTMDIIPYLEEMFKLTLAETEQLTSEKILMLFDRYQGKSIVLPAHENVDDTIYGSLALYQKEIIEHMQQYSQLNSLEQLETAVQAAIQKSNEPDSLSKVWDEIKSQL